MHDANERHPFRSELAEGPPWHKSQNGGYRREVSQHRVHRTLLRMGLQTGQSVHADPCPPAKAPTTGMQASELDHGATEEGRLVR